MRRISKRSWREGGREKVFLGTKGTCSQSFLVYVYLRRWSGRPCRITRPSSLPPDDPLNPQDLRYDPGSSVGSPLALLTFSLSTTEGGTAFSPSSSTSSSSVEAENSLRTSRVDYFTSSTTELEPYGRPTPDLRQIAGNVEVWKQERLERCPSLGVEI